MKKSSSARRIILSAVAFICAAAVCVGGYYVARYKGYITFKSYDAAHFGIETLHSPVDFNHNGVDDYTDILLGARRDAENRPRYDASYVIGGYPADNVGVCADVVWRAFKNAGYSLKDMVDKDIAEHMDLYPRVNGKPDPNIDFRRVGNLAVYFSRFAQSLTTDIHDVAAWQPGDIVIFHGAHIGIVSDKRNGSGVAWLISNGGQPVREEDSIGFHGKITGHYRFDAGKIPAADLIAWKN